MIIDRNVENVRISSVYFCLLRCSLFDESLLHFFKVFKITIVFSLIDPHEIVDLWFLV